LGLSIIGNLVREMGFLDWYLPFFYRGDDYYSGGHPSFTSFTYSRSPDLTCVRLRFHAS